ncbi:hypothetical protein B0H19DRAFT_562377 [Mycena capillaripes]|nr:hypothetical protein B0H19DRAFT_562377 [Mycena capillaripes]
MLPNSPAGPSMYIPLNKSTSDESPERERESEDKAGSASEMWFPVNENVSSSWPPKFTFQAGVKSSQFSRPSLDDMEGIIASHPQSTRSGHTRFATRAIPNRTSRSNSLSVPATPTNLWRKVSVPRGQDFLSSRGLVEGLVGAEKCPHPPPGLGRIRPSPPIDIPEAVPSEHDAAAHCNTPPPPALPPTVPSHPSLLSIRAKQSVLSQRDQKERSFLRLWGAQKHSNPHLPLVFSTFNPLRTLMPPLFWKSISTTNRPFAKVEWNFQKPLLSPALRTRLRSRKDCDLAGERLSSRAFYSGKLRHHCRVCSKDTLLKRLLLVRHWASRADAMFESALSLLNAEDDFEMADTTLDDSFPEGVLLRDRDDFDDDDGLMNDAPLIVERHSECYSLRLF